MVWHGSDSCFVGYCASYCGRGGSSHFSHNKVCCFEEEEQSACWSKDDADLLCFHRWHSNGTDSGNGVLIVDDGRVERGAGIALE